MIKKNETREEKSNMINELTHVRIKINSINFDTIKIGEEVKIQFIVENIGKKALIT